MDLAIQYHQEDVAGEVQNYVFASCGTFAQATVWRALDVDQGQTWEPVLSEVDMGRTSLADRALQPAGDLRPGLLLPPGCRARRRTTGCSPSTARTRAAPPAPGRPACATPTPTRSTPCSSPTRCTPSSPTAATARPTSSSTRAGTTTRSRVDPKNPNVVWTAGIDLMRSDDGGRNWGLASYWWFDATDPNYAHADNHAITFHPKYNGDSNRTLFVASDGGVHRTVDAKAAAGDDARRGLRADRARPGPLVVAQQRLPGDPVLPRRRLPGRRHASSAARRTTARCAATSPAARTGRRISGGDGGYVAVDQGRHQRPLRRVHGQEPAALDRRRHDWTADPRRRHRSRRGTSSSSTRSRWTRPTPTGSGTAARSRGAATTGARAGRG